LAQTGQATFGGTTCYIYSLKGGGSSTPTWNQVIGPATPSGNTLVFQPATLPAPNTVNVGNPSDGNQAYTLGCVPVTFDQPARRRGTTDAACVRKSTDRAPFHAGRADCETPALPTVRV
jgi:hypothetical protein